MSAEISERQLLEMLTSNAGRERGFRLLMKQYGEPLYWHIRRIVVGHDDAEDVLQETSIKIFSSISSYKGDGQLKSWMYRIATNEALQHLRRQTRLFQSIDDLSGTLANKLEAETPADEGRAEKLFQKALLTLPTQQRIAFNLRYYDELSYDEIARITGKNVNTLKTNYHFATEKIKQYIKQHAQ
ncbi:MAG: RNA polymerase sigma factor [Prevotella sp.]|nr:RNA polymerase sigma factor [Prevotella sp.]